jgi:acyl-coenzyme A synthetase/AMP-(fatty) acid ligase
MRFLEPGAEDRYKDAGAKAMLTAESSKPFAEQALMRAPECARLITTKAVFAGDPPPFDPPQAHPEHICFLKYASGSATSLRGVIVTQRTGVEYGD